MNNFAGRIDNFKGITLAGRRHQCFIVLVSNIQFVLNRITGLVHALGRGTPGVNVAVAPAQRGKYRKTRGPVSIDSKPPIQRHQGQVIRLLDFHKQSGLSHIIGLDIL